MIYVITLRGSPTTTAGILSSMSSSCLNISHCTVVFHPHHHTARFQVYFP